MSAKSEALEAAVGHLLAARTAIDAAPSPRRRVEADRAFAQLAALAAPRVRYFIRRYGLVGATEDAEQAGAIALHRAVETYDPLRARFTTHVNWRIRAELQALRHRLYGSRTGGTPILLSLDAPDMADDLTDPDAEIATECGAAALLAARMADRLADDWARRCGGAMRRGSARLVADRALVRRQLIPGDNEARLSAADRHVVRRAFADIALHAA